MHQMNEKRWEKQIMLQSILYLQHDEVDPTVLFLNADVDIAVCFCAAQLPYMKDQAVALLKKITQAQNHKNR